MNYVFFNLEDGLPVQPNNQRTQNADTDDLFDSGMRESVAHTSKGSVRIKFCSSFSLFNKTFHAFNQNHNQTFF